MSLRRDSYACRVPSIASRELRGNLRLRELIDSVRDRSNGIRVDGDCGDWSGIPFFGDPDGDARSGDESRDIISAAFVPRESDFLVCIKTEGDPEKSPFAFWLDLDFFGNDRADVQIGFHGRTGQHIVWVLAPGQEPYSNQVRGDSGYAYEVNQHVELRVPFAMIQRLLPGNLVSRWTDAHQRPFVRVMPFSYNREQQQKVDFGFAMASYRIVGFDYDLDPALPRDIPGEVMMSVPLTGSWYISNGPFSRLAHRDIWAYDFVRLDKQMRPAANPGSVRNTDYYSWGGQIIAPIRGRIRYVQRDRLDHSVATDGEGEQANSVIVHAAHLSSRPQNADADDKDDRHEYFVHLADMQQHTIPVNHNESVQVGDDLGRVGNTGYSTRPHLHAHATRGNETIAITFRDVKVQINPGTYDPWERVLPLWRAREGYFVENAETIGATGHSYHAATALSLNRNQR